MTSRLARKVFGESSEQTLDIDQSPDPQFSTADMVQRSENNILQWMQYLPEDCINRMIEMGWDTST